MSGFDIKEFRRAMGLITHVEDQSLAAVKELFKKLGGDYDTHDLFLNENHFPEFKTNELPAKIGVTHLLPKGCPGLFFKTIKPKFTLYKRCCP